MSLLCGLGVWFLDVVVVVGFVCFCFDFLVALRGFVEIGGGRGFFCCSEAILAF